VPIEIVDGVSSSTKRQVHYAFPSKRDRHVRDLPFRLIGKEKQIGGLQVID